VSPVKKQAADSDAYSVRSVAGRIDETERERSDLELITVGYVEIDTRRWRSLVHHHLRASQFPHLPYTGAMIGVRMGVDHHLQLKSMVRKHAEVAVDALLDGVNQHTLASLLAREKVGLAARTIQFVE
jgi:hypothetical protein